MVEKDVSSRLENKFKLSFLQVEKRFVDLETIVSELNEKLKEFDTTDSADIKQRMDDIEDLIMVEQSGIIELKKMMENKPENLEIPADLQERLKTLESNISNLVEKTEFQSKLDSIQKDLSSVKATPTSIGIEDFHNRLEKIENSLSMLKSQTENVSKELYEKVKELATKTTEVKPDVDFDILSSRIEGIRNSIDNLANQKLKLELNITETCKKIDILENKIRESPTQGILDELNLSKKELVEYNARIDSLESLMKNLIANAQNGENPIKNFEGLEKVSFLNKNVEEETRRLSSKIETIYQNINKELEKVRSTEKKTAQTSEYLSQLAKEVDKNKIDILNRIRKEDLDKVVSSLQRELNERLPDVKTGQKRNEETKMLVESIFKRIEEVQKGIDREFGEIRKSLKQSSYEDLRRNIQEMYKRNTENQIIMNKKIEEIKTRNPTEVLEKRIDILNSKINDVQQAFQSKIDGIKDTVEKRISTLFIPSSSLDDEQIAEIINKLIFLEAKISAVEKDMMDVPRSIPIIIE